MTVAALFALQAIAKNTGSEAIESLRGLNQTHPSLAWALAIIYSALAGLPLTVGFIGKFYVFEAAISSGLWVAVSVGFIGVVAGFYYYLKVIRLMFWEDTEHGPEIYLSSTSKAVIYPAAILILVLGIFPQPILAMLGS
jgi:NADH-quinone oxidoreductase subunit N